MSSLSLQQRDALIQQLNRRLAKLPDEALMALEKETRQAGPREPAPAPGAEAKLAAPPAEASPPAGAATQPKSKLSRREALLLGGGGLLALFSAAAAGGWYVQNEALGRVQTTLGQLQNTLSQASAGGDAVQLKAQLEQVSLGLKKLAELSRDTAAEEEIRSKVLAEYQARLPAAVTGMSDLRALHGELQDMQLELGDNFLNDLRERMAAGNMLLVATLLAANSEKTALFFDYYNKLSEQIGASGQMLTALEPWFFGNENINFRLLRPLQEGLFSAVTEIDSQAAEIQTSWEAEVLPALDALINALAQLRSEV